MRHATDFGFTDIPTAEKKIRVAEVFHTVAPRYDLMNDLMSLGLHRYWKAYTIATSQVRRGQRVLDIAGGTGDLARGFAKRTGTGGQVILADINASMLHIGRDKLINQGQLKPFHYVQADAEQLPFPTHYFDTISIGFGLRNVTDKIQAMQSMYRVLKPGGQLLILEFSQPVLPFLQSAYDRYSFSLLPKLGQWLTGSAASYQYLVESIRRHPDQETLKAMLLAAQFDQCDYTNLTGGIVCLHRSVKL